MCLLVVAAPALRGEIARLYGVLTDDPARPMVDRFLVEQVMSGTRGTMRDQIARALGPDSALIRHGLVQVDPAPTAVFARLSCPEALLDRLRAGMPPGADYGPAELREVLGFSRKFLIPFLEFTDRAGHTQRDASGRRRFAGA